MLHISTVQFQSVVTQPVDVPESAVPSKPTHPTSGRHVSRLIHRQPLQPSPSGSAALQPSLRALHVLIQGLTKGTLLGLRSWPSSAEVTWNDSAMVFVWGRCLVLWNAGSSRGWDVALEMSFVCRGRHWDILYCTWVMQRDTRGGCNAMYDLFDSPIVYDLVIYLYLFGIVLMQFFPFFKNNEFRFKNLSLDAWISLRGKMCTCSIVDVLLIHLG